MTKKNKYEIYVDGSFKNGIGGVGLLIKKNNSTLRAERIKVMQCKNPHQVEKGAVIMGVDAIKKCGCSPKRAVVYTDCLNVVKELDGLLDNIEIKWIPRELNEAHDMSIIARNLQRKKGKKKYYRVMNVSALVK